MRGFGLCVATGLTVSLSRSLLEEGDTIEASFNCASVYAMDKSDGVRILGSSERQMVSVSLTVLPSARCC